MAYGAPFYNYGANGYNTPNNGYVANQAQPNYLYNNGQTMPQNGNQQPLNAYQQGQQMQQPIQQTIPAKTNVPYATSIMDALSRSNEPNTDFFYADQDNPYIYRISIDMQGRKTYKTFEIKEVTEQPIENNINATHDIDLSAYATKDDLKALKDEITNYAMSFLNSQPNISAKPKAEKAVKKVENVDTANKE